MRELKADSTRPAFATRAYSWAASKAMTCTRCGLCLESCPTYTLWGAEPDSPRGRIVLIEDALAPGGRATPEMAVHIDRCLGCMACMSVCPEEVPYRRPARRRARSDRARRRAPGAGAPATPRRPDGAAALGPRQQRRPSRLDPALHTGTGRWPRACRACCSDAPSAPVTRSCTEATLAVLSAEGYEVIAPRLPDCCGALELHSGERDQGICAARSRRSTRSPPSAASTTCVSSAGSCGAALKDYGRLLGTPDARAFSALALDVHELLARAPLRSRLGPLALRVAYHDACQLCHAQGVGSGTARAAAAASPALSCSSCHPRPAPAAARPASTG